MCISLNLSCNECDERDGCVMNKARRYFTWLINEHGYYDVIPVKTGIQTVMDARLRTSGMTDYRYRVTLSPIMPNAERGF